MRHRVEHGDLVVAPAGYERAPIRKHDVRGLVFHKERIRHDMLRNRDDAHAVGNFVHDPRLVVADGIHRDRFDADGNFRHENGIVRVGNIDDQVYIEGRLRVEEYTDRDGNKRHSLEVNGTDMQFIAGGNGNGSGQASASAKAAPQAPHNREARSRGTGLSRNS